jgi:prepilin-type N-terminal cleavage/methylation domain-containing protein
VKRVPDISRREKRQAFTLLELMVAMVILTIAMSIAFQAFSGTIRAWKRGTEVVDGIKHGDFAMSQLCSALNSTIYFYNQRKSYAFKIEKDTVGGLPADTLNFVTASSAFMHESSPLKHGPHRIKLFIDDDDTGNPALFATAMPAIADDEEYEDEYDAEPMLVSRAIQGLEIMLWSEDLEDWTDEWEKENSVPERIRMMIYVASEDENEEPIVFERVLELPVAKSVESKLSGPSKPKQSSSGSSGSQGGGRTITVGGAQPKK